MSKYIKRMSAIKEKFYVFMKIISVSIPVKEEYNKVQIEWKRGDKRSITANDYFLTS